MTISRRAVFALTGLPVLLAGWPARSAAPAPAPLYGLPEARKRFVLWGSYTCWLTAELTGILRRITDDNPKQVSLEWHHYPIHPPDPALHVAGLAFSGRGFWDFTFSVQADVVAAGGSFDDLTPARLADLAKAAGGSEEALQAAYADPAKWQIVRDDLIAGRLLGVVKTPGLFYDGYFLTPAGLPMDTKGFEAALRAMIAKA